MHKLSRRLLVLIGAILALAAPAAAQAPSTVEAFDEAFKGWLQKNKIGSATLSVANRGALVLTRGYSGWNPETPGLIASLSKAVTAVCVGTLVDAGKLDFATRAGEVLAEYFRRNGAPADPRLRDATIAQLLSHRGGFARQAAGDPATGEGFRAYLRAHSASQADLSGLFGTLLGGKLAFAPGEVFDYTNATYLMLGVIIETVSGKVYEDYCRAAVLEPLKLGAVRLHPKWRLLGSFGGWAMTGPQYLTFLRAFDADSKVLGPAARKFLTTADQAWVNDSKQVFYTLGVNVRAAQGGYNTWHYGSWRYNVSGVADGRLEESVGTFAVRSAAGVSWFAGYAPFPGEQVAAELDRLLFAAARAVKTWPQTDGFAALGLK